LILKNVVEQANEFEEELLTASEDDRHMLFVDRIVTSDIVVAVWEHENAPSGVDALVIKGQEKLRELSPTSPALHLKITGIKCADAEEAEDIMRSPIVGPAGRRRA